MRPLRIEEIVPLDRYGPLRDAYRARVIAYKRTRRVALGESATLLFEDRETLRFQVQEMLWVERIREPEKVQAEIDVYNELMPGAGELSATLFLEILEASEIRPTLERLVGLDRHVQLVLGEGGGRDAVSRAVRPPPVRGASGSPRSSTCAFRSARRAAGASATPACARACGSTTRTTGARRRSPAVRESLVATSRASPRPCSTARLRLTRPDGLRSPPARCALRLRFVLEMAHSG